MLKTYISLAVNIILICIITLIEQKASIMFWSLSWLLVGSLIMISFPLKTRTVSLNVYYIFFFIYFLHSYVCNYFYVINPLTDYFYAADSIYFFEISNYFGNLSTLYAIGDSAFNEFESSDFKAFAFLMGIVAYTSEFLDQNNIIVQKLIPVFFSAALIPFLYNLAVAKFPERTALVMTFVYGIFSYSLFYSAVLIRDQPINFLFIILIYLVAGNSSLKKIPLFLVLIFLIYLFRPEHGIFSVVFLIAFLFLYLIKEKSQHRFIPFFIFVAVGIAILSVQFEQYITILTDTSASYLEHSLSESASSSLGLALLKLPWGIKHLSAGLFSQIIPFPFYLNLDKNGLGFSSLSIAALFWFGVWVLIFIAIFTKKLRRQISLEYWFLFIIGVILISSNYVNVDTRRVMAVYPIFFLVSMHTYASVQNKSKILFLPFFLYSLLLIMYWTLKN